MSADVPTASAAIDTSPHVIPTARSRHALRPNEGTTPWWDPAMNAADAHRLPPVQRDEPCHGRQYDACSHEHDQRTTKRCILHHRERGGQHNAMLGADRFLPVFAEFREQGATCNEEGPC